MQEIQILIMPAFKRSYKKLHDNQKMLVNKAIEAIRTKPDIGQCKKGDLAGIYVYKFDCVGQQMLLAYECNPGTRILLALGTQENFYRNMKK